MKKLFVLIAFLVAFTANAAVNITPVPKQQFNQGGVPCNGCKLFTYAAGTTNKLASYTDSTGATPNANPIVLDSNGQADVWLTASSKYKLVLAPSTDTDPPTNAYWTEDQISGVNDVLGTFSASTGASLVGYIQTGAGATATTVQARLRQDVYGSDYGMKCDGTTDDTTALQSAANVAYNSGGNGQRELRLPSGVCVVSSTVTIQSSVIGNGPFENGTGTVIKWTGSSSKVFDIPSYTTGWTFQDFRIDMSNVTTDTTAMYFDTGITQATFRRVEFKGFHSGASWGGTYKNHDGIYVVGGNGLGTPYNMSENVFEHVVFLRLRNGLTVTDPDAAGSGNNSTFVNCFSWTNGWAVKMAGANNTFTMFESNTESGNHAFVLTGAIAGNWTFIGSDFGTGASGTGNQPIYGDTSGAVDLADVLGGTIENSQGGGVPNLVLDAGPTGGKVYRYLAHGVNNFNSTVLTVDQLQLGQSSVTAQFFYKEGTFTPSFTGLTVVLGGGTVTYSGKYTLIGNRVDWIVTIAITGAATTASTAATTHITNMPFTEIGENPTCVAVSNSTLTSYGVGGGAAGGKNMYTPTWAATNESITISGFYFTDGT